HNGRDRLIGWSVHLVVARLGSGRLGTARSAGRTDMADNATGDDVASGGDPSSPDDTSSQGAGDLRSSQGAGNLRGTTRIDDGVLAKIAGLSVREVPGVRAVGGGAARALGVLRERVSN